MADTGSSEVVPTLVADQVYEVLAGRIFSGDLSAGERLRIRDLAAEVGTSVMPVRAAIRRLVENGLAVSAPHRGARVREFTTRELIHMYEVRSLLEVEAARQGAPRITPTDIAAMSRARDRMFRAVVQGDVGAALDEDEALLRTLYAAGGNDVLMGEIESLWMRCRAYKVMGARAALEQRDSSLWEPQPALVEALENGDLLAVVDVTRDSIKAARDRLEKRIDA